MKSVKRIGAFAFAFVFSLSLLWGSGIAVNGQPVQGETPESGDIEIPFDPIKGDINGDDKVNETDAKRLSQYVSGWGGTVSKDVADLNNDSKIDGKDAIILYQHLAGWNVGID